MTRTGRYTPAALPSDDQSLKSPHQSTVSTGDQSYTSVGTDVSVIGAFTSAIAEESYALHSLGVSRVILS